MDVTMQLRAACGHDSRSVDGCVNCEAADEIERLRAAAQRDARRLNFAAANCLLPLDSSTGMAGGNGQRSVAADRASIDRAMCPHEHAVEDWRLHGAVA